LAQAHAFLVEVWPFMVGGLLVVAYMRVDQITVGRVLGERQLGLYAAAVWLLQVWYVIPMTLATSLGPYVARRKATDELAYRRAVMLVSRAFFYAGLVGTLLTVLAGPLAIRLVLGEEYSDAGPLLQAYSLTMPLYFLSLAHNLWLINEGRYLIRVYGAILAGFVTVGLILLLAPRLGVMSACVAAIAAQLVGSLLINIPLDRPAFRLQIQAITFR
jgi:O-antigen/teichoic acid export membrane protein